MPTTPRGIYYPDSNGSSETWEHWQEQAETADAAIGTAAAATLDAAEAAAAALYGVPGHAARYASSSTSIPNVTNAVVKFQTPEADAPEGGITYVTSGANAGAFIIDNPGRYLVQATVRWDGNSAGSARQLAVYQDGVERVRKSQNPNTAGDFSQDIQKVLRCEAGDLVTIVAYQNVGAALFILPTATGAPRPTVVDITRIGA